MHGVIAILLACIGVQQAQLLYVVEHRTYLGELKMFVTLKDGLTTYSIFLVSDLIQPIDNDQPATAVESQDLELFIELRWLWNGHADSSEVLSFFGNFASQEFTQYHSWGEGVKSNDQSIWVDQDWFLPNDPN